MRSNHREKIAGGGKRLGEAQHINTVMGGRTGTRDLAVAQDDLSRAAGVRRR
jgi:hypothetical protein